MPRKIPTLLGLLFVILLVGAIVVVFERVARYPTKATQSTSPKNIEITNVTDTSFTVTWQTDTAVTGAVITSRSTFKSKTIFDERDLTNRTQGKYTTHAVTYREAQANTEYSLTILSSGKPSSSRESKLTVRTGPTISTSASTAEPAYGTIKTPEGNPATGALVYLSLLGSQKLATLVSDTGTWLIPINLIRTEDLSSYLPQEERTTEELVVRFDELETTATTDTLNDAPVPDMILGKTYDFKKIQAKTPSSLAMKPPNVLGESTPATDGRVTIVKPADGASLTTRLPLIQGTGLSGKTVTITLGITSPTVGTTIVGGDGIWRFTPSAALTIGKQSVTITSTNKLGQAVAITHMFEILKSGTQVLGDATPSGTLTPTPTFIATGSPTPISTLSGDPLPESGNMLPVLILLLLSLGLLTTGAITIVK